MDSERWSTASHIYYSRMPHESHSSNIDNNDTTSESDSCLVSSSLPMSTTSPPSMLLNELSSLNRNCHNHGSTMFSRDEQSSLELEAIAAIHELSFAVQSIAVSELLPHTPDLLFVNLTTMEGHPYCLELTLKGWRVTSLRQDCMNGDFRRMELHTRYFETLYQLLDAISSGYRLRFGEKLAARLRLLQTTDLHDGCLAPVSSYVCTPTRSDDSDSSSQSPSFHGENIVVSIPQ